jgi:hypothetical protein
MSTTRVIRYTTKPEHAEENARLIRDVFTELAVTKPEGLRYAAYRLEDGPSFVHVVDIEGAANPLADLSSFAAFQAGISERCSDGPTPAEAGVVGSYPSVAS